VVGSPSAVSTVPSASCAPVVRACKILPLEIVLVAMSSTIGPLPLGTAIAIGLVAEARDPRAVIGHQVPAPRP
jgi:hypothetical protein